MEPIVRHVEVSQLSRWKSATNAFAGKRVMVGNVNRPPLLLLQEAINASPRINWLTLDRGGVVRRKYYVTLDILHLPSRVL